MKAPFTLGTVGHFSLAVTNPKTSAEWYDGVAVEHISFHLPDVATPRAALDYRKAAGVSVEDPGDEIGPEAPGSPNLGIWLHDLDGYRLESNVRGGAGRR